MKKINFVTSLVIIILLASCQKYLDVNNNPNQPTEPPINGLFGSVTYSTAFNYYRFGSLVSNYLQYTASPNASSSSDVFENVDASNSWTNIYDNMTDLVDLEKMAIDRGATGYQGTAKIMMAMHLSLLHDIWGEVPYSKAFTLTDVTPEYDNAEAIFDAALTLLDEGVALLQQGGTVPINAGLDFIHGGSAPAWIRTAYAIKARMLNQLSKTSRYNAAEVLAALGNSYTSNAQDAQVTIFSVRNPWAQVAVDNAGLLLGGWLSKNFVDAMNGTTFGVFDPRLPRITNLTKFGDYRGTRNGSGRVGNGTSNEESVLTTTGWYSSTNSPLLIATYSEMKFIEAEVKFSTNRAESYSAYLEGIRANMTKMAVAADSINTYINDTRVSVGAANLTMKRIMDEKYKVMFLHPSSWTDARRFDYQYTGFEMPLNAVLSTFIRRLDYPSVEISRNGANVPEVGSLADKLWWDQ